MRHTGIMLALAIVLLLLVVLLVVASFAGSSEELVIEFLNVTITTSVGGVFVTGVVCGLIALASVLALRRSWRHHQARAEEVRELRRLAGVPDPDNPDATQPPSKADDSGRASRATEAAGSNQAAGVDDENRKTGEAGTAHPEHAASPGKTTDTAAVPDAEDPPRT